MAVLKSASLGLYMIIKVLKNNDYQTSLSST